MLDTLIKADPGLVVGYYYCSMLRRTEPAPARRDFKWALALGLGHKKTLAALTEVNRSKQGSRAHWRETA